MILVLGSQLSIATQDAADKECGLRCLFIAIVSCGSDNATLDTVRDKLGPIHDEGYSMAQLQEAAKAEGFNTLATKTSLDRLRQRKPPYACIAHVESGHYYCVVDFGEKTVIVMDHVKRHAMPIGEFKKKWTGNVLLISREPIWSDEWLTFSLALPYAAIAAFISFLLFFSGKWIRGRHVGSFTTRALILATAFSAVLGCSKEDKRAQELSSNKEFTPHSPQLALSQSVIRLGIIPSSEKWSEHKISLSNSGKDALEVRHIEVSCPCLQVTPVPRRVGPGETVELQFAVLPHAANGGERSTHFVIHSNDPNNPKHTVKVSWDIDREVKLEPFRFDLGILSPGQTAPFQFKIVSGDEDALKRFRNGFEIQSRGLRARADVDLDKRTISGEATAPSQEGEFTATIVVRRSTQKDDHSEFLSVLSAKVQRKVAVAPSSVALMISAKDREATQKFALRLSTPQENIEKLLKAIRIENSKGVSAELTGVELLSQKLAVISLKSRVEPFEGSFGSGEFVLAGGEGDLSWSQRIPVYATTTNK